MSLEFPPVGIDTAYTWLKDDEDTVTGNDGNTSTTQEAWVVFEGCIKGTFYDLDESVLYETKIGKGDVIVLFRGGHSLEVLDEDTIFYEFKTGPYNGTKSDKEDINE